MIENPKPRKSEKLNENVEVVEDTRTIQFMRKRLLSFEENTGKTHCTRIDSQQ